MKNDGIPRHIELYLFTHLDIYVDYKPVAVDYSRIVDLCQWRTWALVVVDTATVQVPNLLTSLRNKRTDTERTNTNDDRAPPKAPMAPMASLPSKDQQHIGAIAPAFAANIPFILTN